MSGMKPFRRHGGLACAALTERGISPHIFAPPFHTYAIILKKPSFINLEVFPEA